jgi:hypothetical protein
MLSGGKVGYKMCLLFYYVMEICLVNVLEEG